MDIVNDVLLVTSAIILIVMIFISSRYLIKEREVERRIKESSEIVEQIIIELKDRLSKQDNNIMNQEVKLEILEMRLMRFLNKLPKEGLLVQKRSRGELPISQITELGITNEHEEMINLEKLTDTEQKVLGHLSGQESLTARELQKLVGVSREHTARLLKKLSEAGYIKRSTEKRPYVYQLAKDKISTFG